jgi:hypothetical protein
VQNRGSLTLDAFSHKNSLVTASMSCNAQCLAAKWQHLVRCLSGFRAAILRRYSPCVTVTTHSPCGRWVPYKCKYKYSALNCCFLQHQFRISYRIILREKELHLNIGVYNPGKETPFDFNVLLHSYFKCPDVRRCQVRQCSVI